MHPFFSSINWTNINMHVSIHFIPIVIHALEEQVHRYSAQNIPTLHTFHCRDALVFGLRHYVTVL